MRHLATFIFLLAAFATGCTGQTGKAIPDTIPDIEGTITTLKRTNPKIEQSVAVVLVEAIADQETNYPKASVKVDDDTHIEDAEGNVLKVEQLQEQQQVEVWFDGPVMESFPVQAHAAAVRVKE